MVSFVLTKEGENMPQRLDDLYYKFFIPLELVKLKSSVEDNHKILIDRLSKDDRKIVLRIIDALEMICNYQTKSSFIQGFKLGFELTTELQIYDVHSAEIDSQNCGHSFMPEEVQKGEDKTKIILITTTIMVISLTITFPQTLPREPLQQPHTRSVSVLMDSSRDNTPHPSVGYRIPQTVPSQNDQSNTQNQPADNTMEKQNITPSDNSPQQPTEKEKMDTAPDPISTEPKNGDPRIIDGKQQGYLLGFGWVDYMGENEVIYCEDMYENGNKVGIMD